MHFTNLGMLRCIVQFTTGPKFLLVAFNEVGQRYSMFFFQLVYFSFLEKQGQ